MAEVPAEGRPALRPRIKVRIPGTRKLGGFLDESGRMFSLGLEAVHTTLRRPWPFQEFIDQIWFLIKVSTVPVILISIPFGMIISLHVGSFLTQLGMCSVVVTHDIATCRRVADYIGMIAQRHLVQFGTAQEMFESDIPVVRQFLAGDTDVPIGMSEEKDVDITTEGD